MRKIGIVGTTDYPIPATKGGAIQSLVTSILKENENKKELSIFVFTIYDKTAVKASSFYGHSHFYFYKKSLFYYILLFFDKCLRKIFKKKPFSLYMRFVNKKIASLNLDSVVFETTYNEVIQSKKPAYACKFFYHIHADYLSLNTPFISAIFTKIDCFISISDFIKNRINSLGFGNKNYVLKNCIDLSYVRKIISENHSSLRIDYGIDDDEIVVAYCGRLSKEKGCLELIKAFKNVFSKAVLVVIGGSNFNKKSKNNYVESLYFAANEANNRVIFTGSLDNKKAISYMFSADIGVVPSICNEAASLAAIEFRALGKPLIATRIGGIGEYANSDSTLFVNLDNSFVDNLSRSLNDLITNGDKRVTMAKLAQKNLTEFEELTYYSCFVTLMNRDED